MRKSSLADPTHRVLSVRTLVVSAVVLGLFILACAVIVLVLGSRDGGTTTTALSSITSLVAGIVGVAALLLSARQQRMREIADQHSASNADERLVAESYAKAVEQLDSDNSVVRMAGCFALMDIAQDHSSHRQDVVRLLCGVLSRRVDLDDEDDVKTRHGVQSRLADHLRPGDDPDRPTATFWPDIDLKLYGATLIGLNLSRARVRSASFSKAEFRDSALFRGFVVAGGISFRDARFTGLADFRRIDFVDGGQSFHGARFDGSADFGSKCGRVDLSGALVKLGDADKRTWPAGWRETTNPNDPCYALLTQAESRCVTEPGTGSTRPTNVSTSG